MWRQVVAQSPGENALENEVLRYDIGWKALNTMLKSGRSLSGHERNHLFVNQGGQQFKDLSILSGLDNPADGRGPLHRPRSHALHRCRGDKAIAIAAAIR